jgi:hypothetical protein
MSHHERKSALALLSVWAWLASGCLGLQAKSVAVPEPLDMPAPPPRVVQVRDPEVLPPVPLPEEPVRTTPTPPRPRATTPAAETPRTTPEPSRTEPPVDVAKPADESRPATILQTTPAQQEGEAERRIRTLLAQATTDLNRINYRALNADARTQYDTAKRFVNQAEEALRAKNQLFASNLADKAAALAAQLVGR